MSSIDIDFKSNESSFRQDEAKRVRGGLFCITLHQLASCILDPCGSLALVAFFFAVALFEDILEYQVVPVLDL
jgi:hypothetical protein